MRISNINNIKYSAPSFGYDKALNKELKDLLETKTDKDFAKTLSSLNSLCNKIEYQIRSLEKDPTVSRGKLSDFVDIFVASKELLVDYVTVSFDKLNYAKREYEHYKDEFVKNGSKEDDWRRKVMGNLRYWFTSSNEADADGNKPYQPDFDEDGVAKDTPINDNKTNTGNEQIPLSQVINKVTDLSKKSCLEKFEPAESSPKGFDDVAGMHKLKEMISETIIESVRNPEQAKLDFEEYGKTMTKSMLLYGPPGCGKTYITQALSAELGMPLYTLNIGKAGSHYINLTSKNIKDAFEQLINQASATDKPCLLFMDEIDSLCFDRSAVNDSEDIKQVATLLQCMDLIKDKNIIVIGATNKYNLLDPAIRRRFQTKIMVDLPDDKARKELVTKSLKDKTKAQKLLQDDSDMTKIVNMLEGYSNDSICKISAQAALNALKRDRADISLVDFQKAVEESTEEKPKSKDYAPLNVTNKRIGFN